jgi:hypothetical protein
MMRLVEYYAALPASAMPSMDADGVAGYIAGANSGMKTSGNVNMAQPWTFYGLIQWRKPISDPYGTSWVLLADGAGDDIAIMILTAAVAGTDQVKVISGGAYSSPDSSIIALSGAVPESEWMRIRVVANGASSLLQVESTTETGTLDDCGFSGEVRALRTHGQLCAHWQLFNKVVPDGDHDQMWRHLDAIKAQLPDFSTIKRLSPWDDKYRAFGGIDLDVGTTPDTIVSVYRHGTDHANTLDGVVKIQTSTDGGGTWSEESTIHTPAENWDARDPRVEVLASGRWIVSFFEWDGANNAGSRVSKTMYSDDQGGTWSSPVTLSPTTSMKYLACSGYVTELTGGNLILATYGEPDVGGNDIIVVFRSTDAGASWSEDSTVAISSKDASEPNTRLLSGGPVVMLIRSNNDTSIYRATATEATPLSWSTPANVVPGLSAPGFIQLASGDLVLSLRGVEEYYNETGRHDHIVYTSDDDGATWTMETHPMPSERAFMYGTPIQLADGKVYVWWSQEWDGAGFYWKEITDDI